jgi:hypothetical protein
MIWGNLKPSELRNLCPDTLTEAVPHADVRLSSVTRVPSYSPVSPYSHHAIIFELDNNQTRSAYVTWHLQEAGPRC